MRGAGARICTDTFVRCGGALVYIVQFTAPSWRKEDAVNEVATTMMILLMLQQRKSWHICRHDRGNYFGGLAPRLCGKVDVDDGGAALGWHLTD